MRNSKYMDDYNYHDWSKFMVEKPEQKPKGPHFAGVMFDTRRVSDGYSAAEGGGSYDISYVVYFAFPDRETLGEWALRAAKDKKQFFCFEVKKVGDVKLNIDVDLGV